MIDFLDRELFSSLSGVLIASRYRIEAKIPKQMKGNGNLLKFNQKLGASKVLDKLGLKLQELIYSMSGNSVIFNVIL